MKSGPATFDSKARPPPAEGAIPADAAARRPPPAAMETRQRISAIDRGGHRLHEWMRSLPETAELSPDGPVQREFKRRFGELDASELQIKTSRCCNTALQSLGFTAEMLQLYTNEMRAAGGTMPPCVGSVGSTSAKGISVCACKPSRLVYSVSIPRMGVMHLAFSGAGEMREYMLAARRVCGSRKAAAIQIYKAIALRLFAFVKAVTRDLRAVNDDGALMWKVVRALDKHPLVVVPEQFKDLIVVEALKHHFTAPPPPLGA